MPAIAAIFFAQLFYTVADTGQKFVLKGKGFSWQTLLSWKFLLTLVPAGLGFVLLMYGLSKMELSKTIILLGVFGVLLAAISGVYFFQDHLTWKNYLGMAFAVAAIILVSWK
ncbi:MAG: EamA family transporter [Patescibacteria group bacterium]